VPNFILAQFIGCFAALAVASWLFGRAPATQNKSVDAASLSETP